MRNESGFSEQRINRIKSIEQSLAEFKKENLSLMGKKLEIRGTEDGKDVYNITAPVEIEGVNYILGREESAESAIDSKIVWLKQEERVWTVDRTKPILEGEDPSITKIKSKEGKEKLVLGIVKVTRDDNSNIDWKTHFYQGENLAELTKSMSKETPFSMGPDRMKDIRIFSFPDGRIAVFTRPQSQAIGSGRIGFILLDSIDDFNAENLSKAKVIEGQFIEGEWGGVNEIHLLEDGRLGILGHIAKISKEENGNKFREYCAMTFIFDIETGKASPIKIIASIDNFPDGETKNKYLEKVVFSGGLDVNNDGSATLYAGLRDKENGTLHIEKPFS